MSLSDREFQLLSLVVADELPGREVAKRFKEETGSSISYGTLYTTFRRLKDDGLVSVRDDEDEDGRIRFFKATGEGKWALSEARSSYSALANFGLRWAYRLYQRIAP